MSEVKKPPQEEPKKNGVQIFQEELLNTATGRPHAHQSRWRRALQALVIPVLALFTGLVLGGFIIILTSPEFYAAWAISPLQGLKEAWIIVCRGIFGAIYRGVWQSHQDGGSSAERRSRGNPQSVLPLL